MMDLGKPGEAGGKGLWVSKLFGHHGILVVTLSLTTILLCWDLTQPWVGYRNRSGAEYGIMARNYLRHGYLETKLGPVTNPGPARPDEFRYYTHHPFMAPLLVSVSYRIFGINEASARLVSILFTLASLIIWYRILLMQWDRATAGLGLFFMALAPMMTFFSRSILYQSLSLFFVLATLWFYLLWMKSGNLTAYAGMLLTLFVGTLSDWPAYYIAPFLILHGLRYAEGRRRKWMTLGLFFVPIAGFALFLGHLWVIGGMERLSELFNAFTKRSFVDPHTNTPGILTRVVLNLGYTSYLFTPIALALSGVWLVRLGRKLARRERLGPDALVTVLLGYGLVFITVFGSGVVQPHLLLHLGPFVGVSAALATGWLYGMASAKGRAWAVAVIIVVLGLFPAQAVAHTWYIRTLGQAGDWTWYRMGLWIRENSPPEATLLVMVERKYWHHILDYYAERELILVKPERDGMRLSPQLRWPSARYIIAPVQDQGDGTTADFPPCDWPQLEGYACFEIPAESSGQEVQERGQRGAIARKETPESHGHRPEGLWELVAWKLKVFFNQWSTLKKGSNESRWPSSSYQWHSS